MKPLVAVMYPVDERRGDLDLPLLSVSQYRGVQRRDELVDGLARAEDLSNYKVVRAGELVINRMSAYQGALGVAAEDGVVSPDYMVLRFRREQVARYWEYCLKSPILVAEMAARVRGIGSIDSGTVRTPRIGYGDLKRIEVVDRSPEQQVAIADFLDRETAKIDALIAKQERLVAGIQERRDHLVESAVGLVEGRPATKLKHALRRIDQGISPDTSTGTVDAEWWVLKAGCSNNGIFRELESKPIPGDVSIPRRLAVHEGDLVTSRASGSPMLVGSTATVGPVVRQLILSDKTFRLVPKAGVVSRYLYWALNSWGYRAQVLNSISGADGLANNLPLSSLRRIAIWLPDLGTQTEIAAMLDWRCGQLDSLIRKVNGAVLLAQERRSALITAAVTGQLNIGEAA